MPSWMTAGSRTTGTAQGHGLIGGKAQGRAAVEAEHQVAAWLVIATLPAQRRSGELDCLTQIEESRTQGGEKVQNKIVSIIASGACSQGTHIFNQNGKKDKR